MTRRSTRATVLVAATAIAVPLAATPAVSAAPQAPEVPERYLEQQLDWRECTEDDFDSPPQDPGVLECAEFTAPQDWDAPDGDADVTVAVSRLPADGDAERTVVTNPGGPGAPGRSFPLRLDEQERVRATHDVIGFDPRGSGKSSNITCGGATADVDGFDARDRSDENLTAMLDATSDAAQDCQELSGELGPHINTHQTVRDIDLLRQLLDRDEISWVGYSAGTWLGAQYATAFPEHVGQFVLDSNVEFTTDWQESFDWQPRGFERRWRAEFLPWIAEHSATYDFGDTPAQARRHYEDIRAALQDEPVELDEQEIGPAEFDNQIIYSMYNKADFPGLAEFLVAVGELVNDESAGERADARDTVQRLAVPDGLPGLPPLTVGAEEYPDAYDASFWTIPCNETEWTGDRDSLIQQSDRLGKRYPLLGWGWLVQPCVFFDTDPVELPTPTGEGVPPVLMVQATHDAPTPIEGANRAHRNFAGSRMITVTNEGDHGIYGGGNDCVDDIVEDYLVDDVVPDDTRCDGQPLPEPSDADARAPQGAVLSNPMGG